MTDAKIPNLEAVSSDIEDKVEDKIEEVKQDVVSKAEDAKENAENAIQERAQSKPWTIIGWSALAGLVIGFVIGALIF